MKTTLRGLSDPISAVHEERGGSEDLIIVRIKKTAASGKTRWITKTIPKVHPKKPDMKKLRP